jgi:hypothetical protein
MNTLAQASSQHGDITRCAGAAAIAEWIAAE